MINQLTATSPQARSTNLVVRLLLVVSYMGLGAAAVHLIYTGVRPLGPVGAWTPAPAATARPAPPADLQRILTGQQNSGSQLLNSLGFRVFGISYDGVGQNHGAIIGKADGSQQSFGIGEDVIPGARIIGIERDAVLVQHGSGQERLAFEDTPPAAQEPAQ
jgi:general secretion pathway protein C